MSRHKKGRACQPGQINNPTERIRMSINHPKPEHTGLVLVFRVDDPDQAEALHGYRSAFAGASDIEALDEKTYALLIRPGICGCGEVAA